MKPELIKNAAGRLVPRLINGQEQVPFQGIAKYRPAGRKDRPAHPDLY
jgi:citrate lyase subunit alpha/citrate CoA-transferase